LDLSNNQISGTLPSVMGYAAHMDFLRYEAKPGGLELWGMLGRRAGRVEWEIGKEENTPCICSNWLHCIEWIRFLTEYSHCGLWSDRPR
jgi:hypothetical protein